MQNLKQWKDILRKIRNTFRTAQKIIDLRLRYIPSTDKEFTKKRKQLVRIKKSSTYKDYRIMTKKECIEYEKGWALFQKYFFGLWD